MSLKIDELNDLLTQNGVDAKTRANVLKDAQLLEDEKKEERAAGKAPKAKNKFAVLIRGDAELQKKLADAVIVKVKEDFDENLIVDRLKLAVKRNNDAARKQKNVIKAWREVWQYLKRAWTKPEDVSVQIVTKEPVRVIVLTDENAV